MNGKEDFIYKNCVFLKLKFLKQDFRMIHRAQCVLKSLCDFFSLAAKLQVLFVT